METTGTILTEKVKAVIDLIIPIEDLSLAKKVLTNYGYEFFVYTPLQKLNRVEVDADDAAEEVVLLRRLLNRGVKATRKAREDAELKKLRADFQYIHFEQAEPPSNLKTKYFHCVNNKSQIKLGTVKWNSGWRQYCFFPNADTVFSRGCLLDIADFLNQIK